MLFLPIIDRELRGASRQWRTHYARSLAGGIALGVSLYLIAILHGPFVAANSGSEILIVSSILAMIISLYGGVNRTCDSISVEKREDTLGLLFLTHLKGYDIVLGKLGANSLRAFFLLLSVLPILSVPLFLGGVSGEELVRVTATLLNALLLSVSVGILVSVLTRSQRNSHLAAGGIVSFLAILLPVSALLVQRFSNVPWLALYLNLPSPAFALQLSFASSFGLSTNLFWTAIGIQFAISILMIVAACLLVPHTWTTKSATPWAFKDWLTRLNYGPIHVRSVRRARMLDRNPIYWLLSRIRFGPLWPALYAIGTLMLAGILIVHFSIPMEPAFVVFFIGMASNDLAMRIRVASIASLGLGQERQSGALEMILSTPVTVQEMIRGVWRAICHRLMWVYIPHLLLTVIVTVIFVQVVGGHYFVGGFFIVMSIADFIALGYVAMWKGMRLRNVQHAAASALMRVLLLPWILWGVFMSFSQSQELVREWGEFGPFYAGITIWGISTGTAIYNSRRKLTLHFREAATDRYTFEQRTSILTRLGRFFGERPNLNSLQSSPPLVVD